MTTCLPDPAKGREARRTAARARVAADPARALAQVQAEHDAARAALASARQAQHAADAPYREANRLLGQAERALDCAVLSGDASGLTHALTLVLRAVSITHPDPEARALAGRASS